MPEPSRQLVAIMFTDIVGYTVLMGKDSAKALELVRTSIEIQKPLVEKHNGKWLKEMGDGVLAQFNSAFDAVNCAIEIQKSARADLDAKLRIGIHLGDVTVEEGDVYGDGVNVASRLESICDSGGIYISESIEKAIRGQSSVQAKYLGEIRLKNVDYDVRTYALQGVGLPLPDLREDKKLSGRFIAELQRRGVLRSAVTYIILSMLLILLLPYAQSLINLPTWSSTALYAILIAGFPVAMYLAWNYEQSPEGFVKTTSQQSWQNPYKSSQRKPLTSNIIIALMAVVIIVMYLQSGFLDKISNKSGDRFKTEVLEKSIAVLPFYDDSPGKDNEYFCNGMLEEILDKLQKIADINVKSRSSVEKYRGTNRDINVIGNELNVAYLIEGSVRKAGDDLRITAQLIDANTGDHLWSEVYDGKYTENVFDFQSNLARRIASSLEAIITPQEERRIAQKPTDNMTAYDLSLRGWQMLREWGYSYDNTYLHTAYNLFNEALKYDPKDRMAIGGKGTYFLRSGNYDSALFYTDKKIALFPDDASGYAGKGNLYWSRLGQPDSAYKYLSIAVELNPDDMWVNLSMGQLCWYKDDYLNALHYFRKAHELNYDSLPEISYSFGRMYLDIGEYSKAEKYFKESFNMDPRCVFISSVNMTYLAKGRFDKALHFLDSICKFSTCSPNCGRDRFNVYLSLKEYNVAETFYDEEFDKKAAGQVSLNIPYIDKISIAWIYFKTNREDEGNKILENAIIEDEKLLKVDPTWPKQRYLRLAAAYAIRSENEIALKYLKELEKIGFGYGWTDYIEYYPPFENLKLEPEFKAIIRKSQEEKATYRAQVQEMEERGEIDL